MRKWMWLVLGVGSIAACAFVNWYYWQDSHSVPTPIRGLSSLHVAPPVKDNDGNAEASEVVEPLIVDRNETREPMPLAVFEGPLSRTQIVPGMKQARRPESMSGPARRMPYADEDEAIGLAYPIIERILDSTLPRLDLFDEWNRDEEPAPPAWHPHAYPHCPRHGDCPAPFPYRAMPRD